MSVHYTTGPGQQESELEFSAAASDNNYPESYLGPLPVPTNSPPSVALFTHPDTITDARHLPAREVNLSLTPSAVGIDTLGSPHAGQKAKPSSTVCPLGQVAFRSLRSSRATGGVAATAAPPSSRLVPSEFIISTTSGPSMDNTTKSVATNR
jgi:hypothetical protein